MRLNPAARVAATATGIIVVDVLGVLVFNLVVVPSRLNSRTCEA